MAIEHGSWVSAASTADFVALEVPCGVCGGEVACEVATPVGSDLVVFCDDCRGDLLKTPELPSGYELVRELGRGGMGAVFLARHRTLGVDRALKLILPKGAVSEDARSRFLEEARVHARLVHPRIVQVHDLSEVRPGIFVIVMEYVAGHDASALLRQSAAGLEPGLAVGIAVQALEALAYVHAQGIVHCDVKDPNLLLCEAPGLAVKLSDFGLARSYGQAGAAGPRRSEPTCGTVPYMSPEQASSQALRPESDLYSLGATLYHLLTGAFPHEFPAGCDRLEVVRAAPWVPLRERRPELSVALAEVVGQALARAPEQRFRAADALRTALLPFAA
jgi:serine/threonine protein kinase